MKSGITYMNVPLLDMLLLYCVFDDDFVLLNQTIFHLPINCSDLSVLFTFPTSLPPQAYFGTSLFPKHKSTEIDKLKILRNALETVLKSYSFGRYGLRRSILFYLIFTSCSNIFREKYLRGH